MAARTQVARRNDSEEALLAAAAHLVSERGVERASLASIGETAGVSRGLPTHHFGSKDALIARLAQRAQNAIDTSAWAALDLHERRVEEVPGLELLLTAVEAYLTRFESPSDDDRALIVLWGATFPATASVEGMVDADQRSFDGWVGLITDGQRDGSIRRGLDPLASAVLMHGMLRGVAATLLIHADVKDVLHVRRECLAWVSDALGQGSDSGSTSPA